MKLYHEHKEGKSTLQKIRNLMNKWDKVIEDMEFGGYNAETEYGNVELYKLEQKKKRIKQKLRKQMVKYLEETKELQHN